MTEMLENVGFTGNDDNEILSDLRCKRFAMYEIFWAKFDADNLWYLLT